MKAMQCELCGGTNIVKDGDFFVCQNCGMKYTLETAKKMMVEGVVQVEGEVSIKTDTAIKNNLELARSSLLAGNLEKAEKYADEVLSLNQKNAEAWLIKGKSALGQTSIADERIFEMMVCIKSVIDIVKENVRADPPSSSVYELEFLGEVSDLIVRGVTGLCKLYGNAFVPRSSSEIGGKIVNSLPTTLETATKTLELLKACFQSPDDLERFTKIFQDEGREASEARELWEKLNNDFDRVGEIRLQCAEIINKSVVAASLKEDDRYVKDSIFTYYITGGPTPDTSDESSYLSDHQTTLKNYITLTKYVSQLWTDKFVYRYLYNSGEAESWSSYHETLLKNVSSYTEDLKTHRTRRRIVSRYSSGNTLSNDGYVPSKSYIAQVDEQFELYKLNKAAAILLSVTWKQELDQEKNERVKAWWSEHNDLKESLDAFCESARQELTLLQDNLKSLDEQIEHTKKGGKSKQPAENDIKELENTIANLDGQIRNLGFFKRKERESLKEQLNEKQHALISAKKELEKELDEERRSIQKLLDPLYHKKEGLEERIVDIQNSISSAEELLSQIPCQDIINQLTKGDIAVFFSNWKSE